MAEWSEGAFQHYFPMNYNKIANITQRMSQYLLVEGILSISSLERGVGSSHSCHFLPGSDSVQELVLLSQK
jgi:hypothetical protein